MVEIQNGCAYPVKFKETVLAEYKRRKNSKRGKKVGVTYNEIGDAFNISWNTVRTWVLNYKPKRILVKMKDDGFIYKGVLYVPKASQK